MPLNYAKFYSRSHDAVIRVYDGAGNVIETHEHKGDFKEWQGSQRETKSRHAGGVTANCTIVLVVSSAGVQFLVLAI
jgi:hypothetical protein